MDTREPDSLVKIIRELCRMQIESDIKVAALTALVKAGVRDGEAEFERLTSETRELYRPTLERIQRANDQELLDTLAHWRGPWQ